MPEKSVQTCSNTKKVWNLVVHLSWGLRIQCYIFFAVYDNNNNNDDNIRHKFNLRSGLGTTPPEGCIHKHLLSTCTLRASSMGS